MSRLLVDDVTKTDARALLNVNKMATISDIVAPSNEYIYASGANELTVVEGCVIAVGGAGIFKTANTILTAANLDAGSAFAVGKDYYVYICDSRIDSADEKYVISSILHTRQAGTLQTVVKLLAFIMDVAVRLTAIYSRLMAAVLFLALAGRAQ